MARLFDDGASDFLSNANAVAGNGGASSYELAMACFYYGNDGNLDNQILVSIVDDAGGDHRFAINLNTGGGTPDNVRAWSDGGNLRIATTLVPWTVNTWEYACALFPSQNERRIFLNGANKATNADDDGGIDDLDKTILGAERRDGAEEGFFSGSIAEVVIYDLSVWPGASASDRADAFEKIIPSLAAGYSPLFFPLGLKGYWPLIRGLNDRVGGYNMTASGTVVSAHPRIIYPASTQYNYGAVAPPPSGGQVIMISKLLIPCLYLKQGKVKRRDFLKNTFLASLGIK